MISVVRIIVTLVTFSIPNFVFAQGYTLLSPLGSFTRVNTADPNTYFQRMFVIFIAAAAILAVIRLMICGIQYMASESITSKSEAKTCLWYVIGGLFLILISYIILFTVNRGLVGNSFNAFFNNLIGSIPQNVQGNAPGYNLQPGQAPGGNVLGNSPEIEYCYWIMDDACGTGARFLGGCERTDGQCWGALQVKLSEKVYTGVTDCYFGPATDECFAAFNTCTGRQEETCRRNAAECTATRQRFIRMTRYLQDPNPPQRMCSPI